MEEEKPSLARPHQEEFDKLKPILEKQVGSEVTPRRKAMAANEVMAGTPPEVAAELIRHLGTIAPDAIEHMRGEKALRPAWAKQVLDEVSAAAKSEPPKATEKPPGEMFRDTLKSPSPEAISDAAAWLKANGGAKDKTEATRKLVSEFGKPAMKHAAGVFKAMGNGEVLGLGGGSGTSTPRKPSPEVWSLSKRSHASDSSSLIGMNL